VTLPGRHALVAALALAAGAAWAQSVSLAGSLGSRALLMIDGKAKQVAVGSTVDGVKLVSVGGNDAVVEVQGKRVTLVLGGAQVSLGGAPSGGGGSRIVIPADIGGHFFVSGSINGTPVRFVVDTGATNVSLSQFDAERIGIDYKKGERGLSSTANGVVPVYRVSLASVRIGDVQIYNVQGTVLPGAMPVVLLGNSFLGRFQMQRDSDRLTLERRY
jgi:aspartyl protease family protein